MEDKKTDDKKSNVLAFTIGAVVSGIAVAAATWIFPKLKKKCQCGTGTCCQDTAEKPKANARSRTKNKKK